MTIMRTPSLTRQRGLSMLLALIALLVLSLTAVALVRSVDTGTLIVGNIGFKQDTLESSAMGAERAITWLESQTNLDFDDATNGYYASSLESLDPTGAHTTAAAKLALVDWDGSGDCPGIDADTYSSCSTLPFPVAANIATSVVNGNQVQWIITRLCKSAGPFSDTNPCTRPGTVGSTTASDRGELTAGGRISDSVSGPYYRVIVRTAGPRNTVSYTETMVHF